MQKQADSNSIIPLSYSINIEELLLSCDLPVADLKSESHTKLFGIQKNNILIAVIGLEVYGRVGLLRSLAVAEEHRNRGYAQLLVAFLEKQARLLRLDNLFLLTTAANSFFTRLGYEEVKRDFVPDDISQTEQYQVLCPVSAIVMTKRL